MRYEVRKSDGKDYYYLVSIDKNNNEKVIIDGTLKEVQKHETAKDLKPVNEADIRGTVEPPKEPKNKK